MAVVVSTSNLFVYCYFGKLATESFENMAIEMYSANWPELNIGLQKTFLIMMGNAGRPLFYRGFDVAILDLNTFTKVF